MAIVKAAGIFLVNKEGKLLVCHPTNHPPEVWGIPKGKVDKGEDYLDAAVRETFEESNVDLKPCKGKGILMLEPQRYKHGKKILFPFVLLERNAGSIKWNEFDLKCNSNVSADRGGFPEMDDYKWVTLDEAMVCLHYTQSNCIPKIRELLNGGK